MSVIHINKNNFHQEVIASDKPVLLDFWAPWCGPCRLLAPILDQLAEERSDIKVAKVNVDEEMELAVRFGVSSIPTLIVMDGGEVAATAIGFRPKADILKLLNI